MTRRCPSHLPGPVDLPVEKFGINRARKDGRHLYCKDCCRRMVAQQRQANKAMKAMLPAIKLPFLPARKSCETSRAAPLGLSRPARLVLAAIDRGARNQREMRTALRGTAAIAAFKRSLPDIVTDALADLILVHRLVGTAEIKGERIYFRKRVA